MNYHSERKTKQKTSPIYFFLGIILLGGLFLGFVSSAQAATQWVNNPGSCNISDPTNFPGQNCSPERICGDNSGISQCYNTTTLLPPAVSATSNTLYSATYPNGGYLVNCYTAVDAAAPFCDNSGSYWCNRSTTCYTTQLRDTICTANVWGASTCGACRTGYGDCNLDGGVCEVQFNTTNYPSGGNNHYGATCVIGDVRCDSTYYDCDASGVAAGNGCEALRAGACTTGGGLTGTWSCAIDAGGSCTDGGSNYTCTCIPPKQYFETGTKAQYGTTDPLLWGVQFGAGPLITFGNSTDEDLFVVNNDGSVGLAQITAPGVTTDKLYNVAGSLYWNGVMIGAGGAGMSDRIQDLDNTTFIDVDTTDDGLTNQIIGTVEGMDILTLGRYVSMFGHPSAYESEIQIFGGDAAPASDITGGAVVIRSGSGDTNGQGGSVNIQSGSGGTDGNGGLFTFQAGNGGLSAGSGGAFEMYAGSALSNTDIGGYITLRAGDGQTGGNLYLYGGNSNVPGNNGGNIMLLPGNSGVGGANGAVLVKSHDGHKGNLIFDELEANGSEYVGFTAPDTIDASVLWTLPNADGAAGELLVTDGAGNLSWIAAGLGGDNIYTANGTLTGDRTVTSNGNNLTFTGSAGNQVYFEANDAPNSTFIHVNPDEMEFSSSNGLTSGGMVFNSSGMSLNYNGGVAGSTGLYVTSNIEIQDNINSRGAIYGGDYEANFLPRSLVTKQYVDSVAGGGVTTLNLTVATSSGNFSYSGEGGYVAANLMCEDEYPGSHFCVTNEVISVIRIADISGWSGTAWIAEGPPGYTSNSNDCNGWTSAVLSNLGAFWEFNNTTGGMGWLTNCASVKPVACCQ